MSNTPYRLNDRVTTTRIIPLPGLKTAVDGGENGTVVDIDLDSGDLMILLDRYHPLLTRTRNHLAIPAQHLDEIKLTRRSIGQGIAA